jgi:large subunit ribosomal protein L10
MRKGGVGNLRLETKKEIAAELHDHFSKSAVVIVTDYKGLNVAAVTDLRRKLREADVQYKVVKNTLLARASEGTDAEAIKDYFKGPNAVAFSYTDPVAPAKVLCDFAKENDKLDIRIGVLNGKVLDADAIKALAKLPSREQLLAQVLSVMNQVPTSLVTALSDVPRRMVNVLAAIKDQKEAA